jgi:hypothetical protein
MASSNLAVLTQSHKAIAAKRRAKKEQIKEIIFDEDARRHLSFLSLNPNVCSPSHIHFQRIPDWLP